MAFQKNKDLLSNYNGSLDVDNFGWGLDEEKFKDQIVEIEVNSLFPFHEHTFSVLDDDKMQELAESIEQVGVLSPLLVKSISDSDYEVISGHRRLFAAKKIGLKRIPCVVRDLSDDEAIVAMVDSNAYREKILPSERAKSYKMRNDALKRMGTATEALNNDEDLSRAQLRRFIKIADLNDILLKYLDADVFGTSAAYELSFISTLNMGRIANAISEELTENENFILTSKVAAHIRTADKADQSFTEEKATELVTGRKRSKALPKPEKPKFNEKIISQYMPEEIAKAPIQTKLDFTKEAIERYVEYINNDNPEEIKKYI